MFKITHFEKRLCQLMRHHVDLIEENICDIYSIWNFRPRTRWQAIKRFHTGKWLCRTQHFVIFYWLVLAISFMGSVYSLAECISISLKGRRQLLGWRQRKFYVLPPSVLCKVRLVGAVIAFLSWLLLCYAVVKVSPAQMTPWLIINVFVLGGDFIIWMSEVLSGACELKLNTAFSFLLAFVNYLFVNTVRCVFLKAIEMNDTEELSLWKRFQLSFSF